MFLYDGPVATKYISMSYHCMRPHHLYACVHSVRCVWLWKDIALFFAKTFFFVKNPFWRVPQFNQFEFANLIYSSETESEFELCVQTRARKYSVQFKSQNGHCQKISSTFFVRPGETKLWPRNDFNLLLANNQKIKKDWTNPFLKIILNYKKSIFGKIKFENQIM